MKRFCWIGILVLLALAACDTTTREARRMVKCAELLADTLPDSTVRLIDSVLRMPASFSERERMDMALLQAEALFGDHGQEISPVMDDDFFDEHATLSTSPELERAAAYYAGKKQYAKAAHVALYSGFVQQRYNEKESAMRSFKEAEQYGKLAVDSLTVARAEYWMGKMLYREGREQEALNSFIVSESYIGNHYGERALIENSKAIIYILMNQYDDANNCLERGLSWTEKDRYERARLKVLNNQAVLCRIQGKYGDAIAHLIQMASTSNMDETEEFVFYLNMGKAFLFANEMDSAMSYFKRVETLLSTKEIQVETKASAYGALSQFEEQHGDIRKALQYKDQREQLLSKVLAQRQEQAVYRIQKQYDYESLQNEMNKKIIKRHFIILIISILLLVTTVIVLVLQYRHKQLLESEKEMKRQMDALKEDLLQTVKTSVLDHEVSARLRMILTAHEKAQNAMDPKKEWSSLVLQIMNGEEEAFEAARSVLETAYPRLYSTIKEDYPDLTETEAKICLLSCSDLSNTEIADFLGLKTTTVNQNRSNLRKKLNLKPDRMKEQLRTALSK